MIENPTDFDVLIIGGGPAGLSAALWCADLGMRSIILEKEAEFGGQLLRTFNPIENYLGVEVTNGRELNEMFLRHVESRSISRLTNVTIDEANLGEKTVRSSDGIELAGKAIIIATGVRRRKLGVPGEAEFAGRGVIDSGARDRDVARGKRVVIVGGGDAALENALILGDIAKEIIIVHRRGEFSARTEFVESAKEDPVITHIFDTVVTAISGNTAFEGVELQGDRSGEKYKIEADGLLIRIGVVPNSELFHGQLSMDSAGYIETDPFCATSIAGIYGVGDVANPIAPTISNAVGQGSVAAKAVVTWLSSPAAKR